MVSGPEDEDEENDFPYGYPSNEDDNESASSFEATYTANGASKAVATASGDAGLYCNGEQSFSNLWGGSIKELEEDLADMSDSNQSEELARSVVVMASVFGLVEVFILIVESVIGWRVCCERWIVGLVAVCACVSQGVTFLFFNRERYW